MAFARRIILFAVLNVLVVVVLSLIVKVLGLERFLSAKNLQLQTLMFVCLLFGMGGAFISLALSRLMAKWMLGVKVIDPDTATGSARRLLETVYRQAGNAGLTVMPQVGVYDSPEVNAFATGPTRSRALVAVSTGLLEQLEDNEVNAVLGHEIGHIANGDMVTMTLIQGVANAFVLFLSKILAYAIASFMNSKKEGEEESSGGPAISGMAYFIIEMVLQVILMIPATMLICWVSRWREYRADQAGARLAGRENMIQALQALRRASGQSDDASAPALQTLKISGQGTGLMRFFMTHPPLEQRIERLKNRKGA